MKKNIVTLMLSVFVVLNVNAQKPMLGQFTGEKVPLYCGSTGSSSADTTRLPIMFLGRLDGLTPGSSYKYYVRFIKLSDTSSTSATGAGISIFMKKNGTWRTSSNPDLNTGGAHDTFKLSIGEAEYKGWFGALYTSDSRFTPGEYVYPMIEYEEIGSGMGSQKIYISDSIQVLAFSNSQSSGNGTAIYGKSFLKSKNPVLLYDIQDGLTNRPISITYAEDEKISFSGMQNWYTNQVQAKAGSWGTIIPNDLSNGIKRIESRDLNFDTIIFANTELDAIWGSDSTMNRSGGATKPVSIKSDYAPLLMPEFEFVNVQTNLVEANTTVNILVRRRYGNGDSSKISAFRNAGTATDGVDFKIKSVFPKVFKPYGEVVDTIKVDIIDDFSSEPTENIAIRLNKPVNARIGFQTTHSINITDNDIPVVTFATKSLTTQEGVGTIKVKLKINIGSTSATNVKVIVKQKSDSTFIPTEFKLGSSNTDTTVQFPGGKVLDSLEFDIPIIDDNLSEDRNDTIILALRNLTSPAIVGADSLFTLIIEDNDAPSIYWLDKSKITVKENVGSVKIRINKKNGNTNQSDIVISYDSDSKYAQPGSDFTFNTQLLSFFTTDPDSFIITVPIINDNFSEKSKDAVIFIRNSFNARIGKPDTIRITILDDDLPEYKISTVTNSKSPNFIPDSLNVKCAIRGVVYGTNLGPIGTTQGLTFTIRDNTGGIQVYKPSGGTKGYTAAEGDSVLVYGTISQLNGMSQMSQIDTIFKLGSGRALKSPELISALSEATESDLVKFDLVKLADPTQWPSSSLANNTTLTLNVITQSGNFNMIIDSETDIDGKSTPSGFFNVSGLGGQIDNSSPYSSNYVLYPRRISDFTNLVVPVFGFTQDSSRGIENRDSSEGFVLQCANITSNKQITIRIKSGTATRNVDYQANTFKLYILTPTKPSEVIKVKMNDDNNPEQEEYVVFAIRDNPWGTLIGPDSIHVLRIIDDETVGLDESFWASKTTVYPNPAKGQVKLLSEQNTIYSITLLDVNGREVKSFNDINSNNPILDIEDISKGLYTLSIESENGKFTKKLSIF
jgi:hypothetical protein